MWITRGSPRWRSLVFIGLAAACTLAGCVAKSVSPLVTEEERQFEPKLVGNWQGDGGSESAVVTAAGADYAITYTDDHGTSSRFVGRLGRLGSYRVLDLSPEQSDLKVSDSYAGLLLPLHTFIFIDSIGAVIRAHGVQPDSLEAFLGRQPTAIAHVKVENSVVLTAPTSEVRAFLQRFLTRPGVLDSATWKRM